MTVDLGGTQSPGLKNLFTAMAKAQAQIEGASKDKTNPHFKSKYADLSSVWEACRKALTDNGISVMQWPLHSEDKKVHLETILAHSSGESISRVFSIPADKENAHGYGSAITYLRRFSLASVVGVAPEDDDGNAASKFDHLTVTPRAGAKELLTTTELETLDRLASTVIDLFEASMAEEAYNTLSAAKLEATKKTYVWDQLSSKQRSTLTKIGEAKRNTLNA